MTNPYDWHGDVEWGDDPPHTIEERRGIVDRGLNSDSDPLGRTLLVAGVIMFVVAALAEAFFR